LTKLLAILKRFLGEPMGGIATASLMICAVSGIFLAIPYRVDDPYNSISLMLLDNPAAVYFRNIHFWSAQFFLVFTLLHIVDHMLQKTEYNVSRGIWIRLTLSVPVIFFVMISGFMLKGDGDARSAFRILSALLLQFPLAGELLSGSILGNERSLELVYVHHIATATIILFIVIIEHSRKIWPGRTAFLILLFIFLLTGYFFHAPFGEDSGKGPWYFVGFQEILHWLSRPAWSWAILLLVLLPVWILPRGGLKLNHRLKILLLIFFAGYTLLTITGTFFRGENWVWKWPWEKVRANTVGIAVYPLNIQTAEDFGFYKELPVVNKNYEGCLVCHSRVEGLAGAHDPQAVGCYSCHLGNPNTLEKNLAHSGMIVIPGNLSDAGKSCGTASCHPGIPERLNNSIMATMSGVVTVDRFVFGETGSLDEYAHIRDIGHTAADQHLRDLCANCHLGNPKQEPGPISQTARGGGCNACHLNYSDSALICLTLSKDRLVKEIFYHPQININIFGDHCFACHSRSGRIALSYEGWHETLLETDSIPDNGIYKVLEDRRVVEYIGEDVHHRAGMTCADCHISYELMGDGNVYAHKEDQVKIRCEDCHFSERPAIKVYEALDAESKKIIAQRKWQTEGINYLTVSSGGYPLLNAWIETSGKAILRSKSKDTMYVIKPPAGKCSQGNAHKALSCESCHSAWVPQCIGCHNSFDPEEKGFDMLENRYKNGSWVEFAGRFMTGPPVLGIVRKPDGTRAVKTFTPGMVLSIDTASYEDHADMPSKFGRFYAPVAAHTTVREGRRCASCHLDPLAIGYGRGELIYITDDGKGRWTFLKRFAPNAYDNLPEDAWIEFLKEPASGLSTRENTRPFNLEEQKAILTVGSCLTCHDEKSEIMQESLDDFKSVLARTRKECIFPTWFKTE
jgi:hypothetical protein